MSPQIINIITAALKEINEELSLSELENPDLHTKLFGGSGALDSLALVSFIADVEEKISDAFGKNIVLADEKAMSQKVSPFRSVETLSLYIEKLLND